MCAYLGAGIAMSPLLSGLFKKNAFAQDRKGGMGFINEKEALFYEKIDAKTVRCTLCPRYCVLTDGMLGFCRARRPKDGIVYVDHKLCVGCKTCVSACPWGAPQWDPEKGKVVKCDYCMDRIDAGLKPACVTACTTHCLKFDRAEHIPQTKRDRYARAMAPLR